MGSLKCNQVVFSIWRTFEDPQVWAILLQSHWNQSYHGNLLQRHATNIKNHGQTMVSNMNLQLIMLKKSNTEKVNLNMFSVEKFMLQSTNESLEELLKLLLMKTYPNSGIWKIVSRFTTVHFDRFSLDITKSLLLYYPFIWKKFWFPSEHPFCYYYQ